MRQTTTGGTIEKADAAGTSPRPTRRRRWVTYAIAAGAMITALAALGAHRRMPAKSIAFDTDPGAPPAGPTVIAPAVAAPAVVAAKRPQVEVVFALDTTSSMGGLIEGAKQKIWSIASFIAKGQPTPDLRIGLVAYRDIGDAYVTKVYDLDGDLDRVYRHLRQFRAEGGGDGPEHVARGLDDAVHKMQWSSVEKQEVLRLIYLVGDAPAHTDYDDGYSLGKATRAAVARGIQVHAIRCGNDPNTEEQWRKVAMLGKGQFLTIGQDGGMHEEHTPYDDELSRLHDEVSDTVVTYGSKGAEARAKLKEAAAAPAPVKAARASFLARSGAGVGGGGDLVEGVASGRVDLDKVSEAELPENLRALAPAEKKARIASLAADRKKKQERIEELSRKRDEFIASHVARPAATAGMAASGRGSMMGVVAAPVEATPAAPPPASFDAEVTKTVVRSAKRIGVSY